MSKRIDLLRLDYAFSVIIPLLIAIFLNRLNIFYHIDIIFGFLLLAITGNTWNDVVDMRNPSDTDTIKRVEGYHPREIFTIGLASFFLGITLLIRTSFTNIVNLVFLVVIIGMVISYCIWIKGLPIVNQLFLAISHVILPYLMIKVDANILNISIGELLFLIAFFFFSVLSQIVHEVIDGDAIRKYFSLRHCQVVIWIFSILTLVFAVIAFIFIQIYYFIPFLFVPFGTLFTFRRPTASTKGVKDVGILIGNLLMLYFICLITLQMVQII